MKATVLTLSEDISDIMRFGIQFDSPHSLNYPPIRKKAKAQLFNDFADYLKDHQDQYFAVRYCEKNEVIELTIIPMVEGDENL